MQLSSTIEHYLLQYGEHWLGSARTRSIADRVYRTRHRVTAGSPCRLHTAVAIEDYGLVIAGWVIDHPASLDAVSIKINDQELDQFQVRWRRTRDKVLARKFQLPADASPGIFLSARVPSRQLLDTAEISISLYAGDKRIYSGRLEVMQSWLDPLGAVKRLLQATPEHTGNKKELFDSILGPAIKHIWDTRAMPEQRPMVKHYNSHLSAGEPVVSLIIPVYGRFDFIEYQLSLFADDPSMHNCEIIYVLDDPSLSQAVATRAATLESVYRIAWSIVYLPQNLGFAGANNSAAQYAHAPSLLLMNSDVIPFENGWLDALLASATDHLCDSVIGVQLLYEDRTVQHNGMRFESSEAHDGLWINIHPGKGMPVSLLPDQSLLESCEAVSGACLLITRENFQLLQGFDESYIIGDFEDSDLCLRARASGLSIRICRGTSMCHLERLSQSMVTEDRWKTELTYYNCWLHSSKWDDHIRQLVAREANA